MSGYGYGNLDTDDFDNPFADPVTETHNVPVTAATAPPQDPNPANQNGTSNIVSSSVLEDYNPFEKTAPGATNNYNSANLGTAAVLPTYDSAGDKKINVSELEQRQRELEAREQDLRSREEALRRQTNAQGTPNNFPPLPGFCPIGSCYYQAIDVEIPIEYRKLVQLGFYLWLGHAATWSFNIVGNLANMILSSAQNETITNFGLSIIYLLLLTPLSYATWFRCFYRAFRANSSFFYFLFFICFGIQIILVILQALGINFLGGCGWINSLVVLGKSGAGAGIIMLIVACMFTCLCVLDVMLFIHVHRLYRGTGGSLEKAKSEFNQGIASNEAVRSAAMSAGSSAFTGVVSSNSQGRY